MVRVSVPPVFRKSGTEVPGSGESGLVAGVELHGEVAARFVDGAVVLIELVADVVEAGVDRVQLLRTEGEAAVMLSGGASRPWAPWVAVGIYDLASKALSLGVSWLFMRESPTLMTVIVPIVAFGYLGSLAGLWFGRKTIGELKHAGLVR